MTFWRVGAHSHDSTRQLSQPTQTDCPLQGQSVCCRRHLLPPLLCSYFAPATVCCLTAVTRRRRSASGQPRITSAAAVAGKGAAKKKRGRQQLRSAVKRYKLEAVEGRATTSTKPAKALVQQQSYLPRFESLPRCSVPQLLKRLLLEKKVLESGETCAVCFPGNQ